MKEIRDDDGGMWGGAEHWAVRPVVERMAGLVGAAALREGALENAVSELETELGKRAYSELIFVMAHLWFEPDEAREHWHRIIALQREMENALQEPVDVRVALVRYFVNVTQKINNPKVLELEVFRKTEASVYRDELTGLYNYRYLQEHLRREVNLCKRHHSIVSAVMIDVDDFKHYNDRNGHLAGNEVLVTVGDILRSCLRDSDTAVRYGGEEFTLVLPATTKGGAIEVAERVRKRISEHPFPQGKTQPGGRLTVSLGIATYPADATEAFELLRKADRAMYLAKSRGKNTACGYKGNKRSHQRLRHNLQGHFCELSSEYRQCRTLDISEAGLLIVVDHELSVGTLLDLKLSLGDDSTNPLRCSCRVVRVEDCSPEGYRAAVCIGDMPAPDRQRLSLFLGSSASENDEEYTIDSQVN